MSPSISGLNPSHLIGEILAKRPVAHGRFKTNSCPTSLIAVGMHDAAMTHPGNGRERFVGTMGLGPCVGLTLFDPVTQLGLVGHVTEGKIYEYTDHRSTFWAGYRRGNLEYKCPPETVKTAQRAMIDGGAQASTLQAGLYGGDTSNGSVEIAVSLIAQITNLRIPIAAVSLAFGGRLSIALDTTTGEVFRFFDDPKITRAARRLDVLTYPEHSGLRIVA